MSAFDSIAITVNGIDFVKIARPSGPIDAGYLPVDGFAISNGQPYFSTDGEAGHERARLWIDPATTTLWLEAA